MILQMINIIPGLLFTIIVFYGIYSIFKLVKTLINILRNRYDELERKSVFDSLGVSMIIIILLHLIQLVLGIIANSKGTIYNPIISPGTWKGALIQDLTHFESIVFDCLIIGIIYTVNQLRYGLINKKQAFKPFIIIFIIIIIPMFFTMLDYNSGNTELTVSILNSIRRL